MNSLDIAIAVTCLWFAAWGVARGFVTQAFSLAGLVLGHIAGTVFFGTAQKTLKLEFPHGEVAAYLIVFMAVYLIVRLLGMLVGGWVRGSKLSGSDRFIGLLLGLAKGAILSIILVFALVALLPRDASVLRESALAPRAITAARWMAKAFPDRVGAFVREKLDPAAATPPEEPQARGRRKGPAGR